MEKKTKYAGFWLRLAAYIIDSIIILAVYFILSFITGLFMGISSSVTEINMISGGLWFLYASIQMLFVVAVWLYYAIMESTKYQGTLGKIILGLKVTDMKGKKISFGRATGRYFAKIISSIIFMIGYLMVAFTEKKQGLHDMIAGCLVLKE